MLAEIIAADIGQLNRVQGASAQISISAGMGALSLEAEEDLGCCQTGYVHNIG
ncbi:hypothetical protein D3C76_1762250 [compost metagenome]